METSLALRGQRHKHGLAIIYFHDLGDDELNGLLDGDHLRPISKPFWQGPPGELFEVPVLG